MNPDVQSKLQDDIDDLFDSKRQGEAVTQDDVTGLKYLDQVVCEGQRLGCFAFTARLCTKNWAVPGSDFVIPANTRVVIPIVRISRFIFLSSHISHPRLDFTMTRNISPTQRGLTLTGSKIKDPMTASPFKPSAQDQGGDDTKNKESFLIIILPFRQCLGKNLFNIGNFKN